MRLSYLFNAIGLIFTYIGIVTFSPIVVALIDKDYNSILPFLIVGFVAIVIGFCFKNLIKHILKKDIMSDIKKSEGLTIVLLAWVIFAIIASIPYTFYGFSIVNAFFEGISGVTTTGSSIFTHYDYPKALFFWRALTQWLGGMGIIVLFIAILPQFAVAGRQMFFAEAPGPTEDKLTPRIRHTATALWGLYIVLTIIQILMYIYFKMSPFDAVCNTFATISSGGFSPNPQSIAGYNSIPIAWVTILFMFFSGCNLALIYKVFTKFNFKLLFKNEEFKFYIGLIILITLLISLVLYLVTHSYSLKLLTEITFAIVTTITSTGSAYGDYGKWAIAAQVILFIVIFFGSSAGSTGGGVKIMRMLIIFKYLKREVIKLFHPTAVIAVKVDNTKIDEGIIAQIVAFIMFYIAVFLSGAILVSIIENDVVIGISGSISTLNLIGPGFGSVIGPVGNYDSLNSLSKIIFMFNMMVGRLELVPFLILLNRDYWSFKK